MLLSESPSKVSLLPPAVPPPPPCPADALPPTPPPLGQLLLGTDKRHPVFAVYADAAGSSSMTSRSSRSSATARTPQLTNSSRAGSKTPGSNSRRGAKVSRLPPKPSAAGVPPCSKAVRWRCSACWRVARPNASAHSPWNSSSIWGGSTFRGIASGACEPGRMKTSSQPTVN